MVTKFVLIIILHVTPLKVFYVVVSRVAVLVIYAREIIGVRYKRHTHQSVYL